MRDNRTEPVQDIAELRIGGAIPEVDLPKFVFYLARARARSMPDGYQIGRDSLMYEANGFAPLHLEVPLDRERRVRVLEGELEALNMAYVLRVPRTLRDDACEVSWFPGEATNRLVWLNAGEQPMLPLGALPSDPQRLQTLLDRQVQRLDDLLPFAIV